jgi:hypothetical protein
MSNFTSPLRTSSRVSLLAMEHKHVIKSLHLKSVEIRQSHRFTFHPPPRAFTLVAPSPRALAIFFSAPRSPAHPSSFPLPTLRRLPYSFPHAAAPGRSPPFLPIPLPSFLASRRRLPFSQTLPHPHQSTERCHRPSNLPASPPSTQSMRVPPPSPLHRHL